MFERALWAQLLMLRLGLVRAASPEILAPSAWGVLLECLVVQVWPLWVERSVLPEYLVLLVPLALMERLALEEVERVPQSSAWSPTELLDPMSVAVRRGSVSASSVLLAGC